MSLEFLALPIVALLLGAVAVGSQILQVKAFDRRWHHDQPPGA